MSGHSVSSVSKIKSIIFRAMCAAVRIQFTHFSNDDCENTCALSYHHRKSEVCPICHCLGFGQETMVCTIRLLYFHKKLIGYSSVQC